MITRIGETGYGVNREGQVFHISSGRLVKPFLNRGGYVRVSLHLGRHRFKKFVVHRLVAHAFIPNPDSLPVVHHIDGNRTNNVVSNLMWATHAYNSQQISTLSPEQVAEIKALAAEGRISQRAIGARFGVTREVVLAIHLGKSWRSVTMERYPQ